MNKMFFLSCLLVVSWLPAQPPEETRIGAVLDAWHQAAARADFDGYFGKMAQGGVFVGTDATEHWDKDAFMAFSRPYFEKGQAWSFTPLERHIYLAEGGQVAWFDELLDTWMQLCRGSGVVVKVGEEWKIAHYVLSMTIPNASAEGAIALKKEKDSVLKRSLLLTQPN